MDLERAWDVCIRSPPPEAQRNQLFLEHSTLALHSTAESLSPLHVEDLSSSRTLQTGETQGWVEDPWLPSCLSHPGKHLNGLLWFATDNSCRPTILIASINGKTKPRAQMKVANLPETKGCGSEEKQENESIIPIFYSLMTTFSK